MAKDTDQGAKNLASAISGDVSLNGSNKEQVSALGGEIQDDLDGFDASKVDRGDSVEPKTEEPEDRGDKVTEPEETEEKDTEETKDEETEEEPEKGQKEESDPEEGEESEEEDSEEDEPAKAKVKDEEPEEKDEPEDEEEKPAKKPSKEENRIPKSRFDEVNARRKAAEDELAALKAQQKAKEDGGKKTFDFKQAERDYLALALDGKIDEALAKRAEIDAAKEAEWEAKQTSKATTTVSQREVEREIGTIVEEYEAAYPAFNPESEEFSEDIIDDVKAQYIGYLNARTDLTPPQAFKLALHNAIRIYGLEKAEGAEEPAEAPQKKGKTKVVVKEKKQTKEKIAIAKKAPKNPDVAGDAGDKGGATQIDIENITDAEFNALPESTKARLRGDFFEG